MERTQVQFTPEQIAALRSLSAKTGKPVAELVSGSGCATPLSARA
ncbi:MAG: hypothetical protein R2762_30565 [Bryobacteraceae bacterium]